MSSNDYPSAQPFLPDNLDYDALADAAAGCQGCPLYEDADNVVFGEGATAARLMLVGESPGRSEDAEGRPFVGSAGGLLDKALEEVGLAREDVYITNAVKHIRWESKNGRRSPKTPGVAHINACRPWLAAEMQMVTPQRIVALGTRAARSVLGEEVTISGSRGKFHNSLWGVETVVTYHPAAGLRSPSSSQRESLYNALVEDLRLALRPPETPRPERRA